MSKSGGGGGGMKDFSRSSVCKGEARDEWLPSIFCILAWNFVGVYVLGRMCSPNCQNFWVVPCASKLWRERRLT